MNEQSPLIPTPDYGLNPHDPSDTSWYREGSVNPQELEFFSGLIAQSKTKTAFQSSYMFTPDGNYEGEEDDSPSIMVHDVHPGKSEGDPFESRDLDRLARPQGFGQFAVKAGHVAADIAQDMTKLVTEAQQDTAKAQKATADTQKATKDLATANEAAKKEISAAPASTTPAPATTTPAQTAPKTVTSDPNKAVATKPPPPSGASKTYGTASRKASLGEQSHTAWFQSNPYMQFNYPSPMNPAGQYNDMNYNPRPTYFEQGSGDSSFSNLHTSPNGNYSRDTMAFGGVTDLLLVPPADPRWVNEAANFEESMPVTRGTTTTASLVDMLDAQIMHEAKKLSTEDNPYIRDYSEVRPLNNNMESINAPEQDPNDIQDQEDVGGSLHQQPSPRSRATGPQSLMGQFDPNNAQFDPFISTVSPGSADGTRFSVPSYKLNRPAPTLLSMDLFKDH